MATQPMDPNPDNVPQEAPPPSVPDEFTPDGGDIDMPGQTPSEDPGAPGKSMPIE